MLRSLTVKFAAIALASLMEGCAQGPYHAHTNYLDENCRVGTNDKLNALIVNFSSSTERTHSQTCRDGQQIATLARMRLNDGSMNPVAAYAILESIKDLETKIETGNNVEANQERLKYTNFELGKIGLTRQDLEESIKPRKETTCQTTGNALVMKCK